jgi:hypothetical protein
MVAQRPEEKTDQTSFRAAFACHSPRLNQSQRWVSQGIEEEQMRWPSWEPLDCQSEAKLTAAINKTAHQHPSISRMNCDPTLGKHADGQEDFRVTYELMTRWKSALMSKGIGNILSSIISA